MSETRLTARRVLIRSKVSASYEMPLQFYILKGHLVGLTIRSIAIVGDDYIDAVGMPLSQSNELAEELLKERKANVL